MAALQQPLSLLSIAGKSIADTTGSAIREGDMATVKHIYGMCYHISDRLWDDYVAAHVYRYLPAHVQKQNGWCPEQAWVDFLRCILPAGYEKHGWVGRWQRDKRFISFHNTNHSEEWCDYDTVAKKMWTGHVIDHPGTKGLRMRPYCKRKAAEHVDVFCDTVQTKKLRSGTSIQSKSPLHLFSFTVPPLPDDHVFE